MSALIADNSWKRLKSIRMDKLRMCDACSRIEIGRRDAAAHTGLKKEGPVVHHGIVVFQRYVCKTCGTIWLHTNDPDDPLFGWNVAE